MVVAAQESGLWQEYESDSTLRTFYMRKLLKRGWAGQKTAEEAKYTSLARRAMGKGPSEAQQAHLAQLRAVGKTQSRFSPKDSVQPEPSGAKQVSLDVEPEKADLSRGGRSDG